VKKVVVIQSNYIPWKGYFDLINDADLLIFYDDVQYTKNDWRNRNKVKTPRGTEWLTIPVGMGEDRLICEVELPKDNWVVKHLKTIQQNYAKAPFFKHYFEIIESFFLGKKWTYLSELNQSLIIKISKELLGIKTEFSDSRIYHPSGKKLDRLIDLLMKTGAGTYISGPSARDYIDEKLFRDNGIGLIFKDYSGYPEYKQLFPPFDHYVSIIDLVFNVGPDAPYYIWGWRRNK
jgi:hypothetical protein